MEWVDGLRCTDPESIRQSGLDVNEFIRGGVRTGLRMLLEVGSLPSRMHQSGFFHHVALSVCPSKGLLTVPHDLTTLPQGHKKCQLVMLQLQACSCTAKGFAKHSSQNPVADRGICGIVVPTGRVPLSYR